MESPVVPRTLRVGLRMAVMTIHHSEMDTLPPMEFSYTRCTDLFSTMAAHAVRLPQTVCTIWEAPERPLH